MKKLLVVMLVLFSLIGCVKIQFQNGEQIALQVIAQRVGYYVTKDNPDIVEPAKIIAQGVFASETSDTAQAALQVAITILVEQFPDDPLLESDLKLITSGLKTDTPNAEIDLELLRSVVAAFLNGMEAALVTSAK